MTLEQFLQNVWYPKSWRWGWLAYPLLPLSWAYYFGTVFNNWLGQKQRFYSPIPMIIIGNVTTGGTGKTPVLIALAKTLEEAGLKVGIISRGYKSQAENLNHASLATQHSSAAEIGDEPFLIFKHTACPLAINANRKIAINALLDAHPKLDVILSDDGMQNPKLARDMEIAVLGETGLGNGLLLPAGPLREPVKHLDQVDFCIYHNQQFYFKPKQFCSLTCSHSRPRLTKFKNQTVYAIAGIANPERFFRTLRELEIKIIPKTFSDHYAFQLSDFTGFTDHPIIMTEKDAVKCFDFNLANAYYLEMSGTLDPTLQHDFLVKVRYHIEKKKQDLIVLTNLKATG